MKTPLAAIFSALLVFFSPLVGASEPTYEFSDRAKRELFLQLTQELRCPKCQNQNIADSNAVIAQDLKRKVYQLVDQGKSRREVIDFMKARYGDFVHYQPPVTPVTLWLWLLPAVFIVAAIVIMVRRRNADSVELTSHLVEQADELLKDE